MKIRLFLQLILFVSGLVWSVSFFVAPLNAQDSNENVDEEEIEEVKEEQEEVEEKLEEELKEKEELNQDLSQIQRSLVVTQSQINSTQEEIDNMNATIVRKEAEIQDLEDRLDKQKIILSGIVQDIYYVRDDTYVNTIFRMEQFLGMKMLEDSFMDINHNLRKLAQGVIESKGEVEQGKIDLEADKKEKQSLLDVQSDQKQSLVVSRNSTQSQIYKKDATIGELQAKLSKIRSELNSLLGKSYDASDIKDAAKFASKVTGVRKDFLMGMLVVESDLGRYTGGCTYDEVSDGAKKAYKDGRLSKKSYERMKYRKDIFEDIIDSLGYDEDDVKVSCNPSSYAGTGGAMGVPQFMSDTWMGYKDSIAAVTGHSPPDPWNLTDGVSAMAVKLAKVPGVTSHKESAECDAAKLYLSGTTSSTYNWYCEKVLYWADNYKDKL